MTNRPDRIAPGNLFICHFESGTGLEAFELRGLSVKSPGYFATTLPLPFPSSDPIRSQSGRRRLLGRDRYTAPGSIRLRALDHRSVRKNLNAQRSWVLLLCKKRGHSRSLYLINRWDSPFDALGFRVARCLDGCEGSLKRQSFRSPYQYRAALFALN